MQSIEKIYFFGPKNLIFQNIFSRKFFCNKLKYLSKKKFLNFFVIQSQNIFQFFLRKRTFLNIPFKKKACNVKIGQDALFLVLFNKKCQNMQKKFILMHFLKNRFFANIENFKIFWDKGDLKFFFYNFPTHQALFNLSMQKNFIKIDFGGMR